MTVTAEQFRRWLTEFNIADPLHFANAIGRDLGDVMAWHEGKAEIPPYIRLTIVAVRANLAPYPIGHCEPSTLGVERSRVRFWNLTGQDPISARLAMAGAAHEALANKPLTGREREILRTIRDGSFYRVGGGWRTLHGPKYRAATVSPFIGRGLVRVDGHYLRLTPQGRKMLA